MVKFAWNVWTKPLWTTIQTLVAPTATWVRMVVAVSQHLVHFLKYAFRMSNLGYLRVGSSNSVVTYLNSQPNAWHRCRPSEAWTFIALANKFCLSDWYLWPLECTLETPQESCVTSYSIWIRQLDFQEVGVHHIFFTKVTMESAWNASKDGWEFTVKLWWHFCK